MDQDSSQPLFDLNIYYESGNTIKELSRWVKFIAIVFFIALGLLFIGLLFTSTAVITFISSLRPELAGLGGIALAVIIVLISIYVFVSIQLFRFADMTKKGIELQDQQLFNDGLKSFKLYLLVTGILAMLSLLVNIARTIAMVAGASFLNPIN